MPVVLAAFVALAVPLALTRPPHTDEGHFASAGAAFAEHGRLVMPMWTEWVATLDERLYATMPLYFVVLGGWFKAFGVTFESMRLLSVVWGVVLVAAWYVIGREIRGDRGTGILVAIFVGLNYDVINAATARYDIMAAGLGAVALAAYLTLRERRIGPAIVISVALVTAACLVHPYGVFGAAGLLIFAVTLDWRRFRVRHLLLAAAPAAVELGLWGLYVAQDPAMFREQFGANAAGRLAAYHQPLDAIASELRQRYLVGLGSWRPDLPVAARAKVLLLAVYAGGIVGCALTPAIRRAPAGRALLFYALAVFLMLMFLESNRWYIYLIHAVPVYAACAALFASQLRERGRDASRVVAAATALFVLFTIATIAYRVREDVHGRAFEPTVAYLRAQLQPGDLVMAGGEFGVGLGFREHVLDDMRVGFGNGLQPRFVVISRDYAERHRGYRRNSPATHAHVAAVLARYRPVFESPSVGGYVYRVYERP